MTFKKEFEFEALAVRILNKVISIIIKSLTFILFYLKCLFVHEAGDKMDPGISFFLSLDEIDITLPETISRFFL